MDKTKTYLFIGAGAVVFILVLMIIGIIPGLQTTTDKGANLVMWGLEDPKTVWEPVMRDFQVLYPNIKIQYIQKNVATLESELVNTIAIGAPKAQIPDIVVFPSDRLLRQANKLWLAPVGLITEKQLKNDYIDAEEMFWSSAAQTVIGLPLYGDVLVLYSNKGLLTKHFLVRPAATWDEFIDYSRQITEKDPDGNIMIAGTAMGRSGNINNASDIITALFLQFGENIVDEKGRVVLGKSTVQGQAQTAPAESALQFFNNFANPKKNTYAWSFASSEAQDMFISGKLGMYIGFMSEYETLRAKNPHLDITVSLLPQLTNAPRPITTGKLYLMAVPRTAPSAAAAWNVIAYFTGEGNPKVADAMKTASPRRGVLPSYQKEAVRSVFADSLLALKLWRMPEPNATKNIFNTMIEDLAFGRGTTADVLRNANAQLGRLLPK